MKCLFVNGPLDGMRVEVDDTLARYVALSNGASFEYYRQVMQGEYAEKFGKSVFVHGILFLGDLEKAFKKANGPEKIIRALLSDLGPTLSSLPSVRAAYDYLEQLEPADEKNCVVYFELGGKKFYDTLRPGIDDQFDVTKAKLYSEADARKRIGALSSQIQSVANFRYERR